MIKVSRLNGKEYYINCELIESIEQTPDTIITFLDGKKFVVNESPELIIDRIIEYKRNIFSKLPVVNKGDN